MKKADLIEKATKLYSNPELTEAGITDALDYIHSDLTVDEIKEYIKFITKESSFSIILGQIEKLRSQRPPNAWKMRALEPTLWEYKELDRLHKELKKEWKKRPKIDNREVKDEV